MSLDVDLMQGDKCVYEANITHNLGKMAEYVGIYKACWRPEEIGAKFARDITPILIKGYKRLVNEEDECRKFDDPNGWGIWDNFVPWVGDYLLNCIAFPDAEIRVSR